MTIKRVALITPPYHSGVVESAGTWLNVGFVYIAGSLRAAGYEVDYYDAMSLWHKWPDIRKRIDAFKPDVVATTAYTASIVDGLKLLSFAKEINPEIITVLGNVHWDLVEWPIYTYRAKNNARLAIVSSSRGCLGNCSGRNRGGPALPRTL